MDFDEKRRRQMIRVIIAEVGMVLSVAAIVVVSVLAAMGFMISGNGGIEQSGLVQLHTLPTGASVKIDGNAIFSRTNLSRTLTAGTHHLEVYRDGYDTWQKDIDVRSGVLMRIYYPRLFLQNRTPQALKLLTEEQELDFYVPSPNRNYILYAKRGAVEWQLLDMRSDEIKITPLDLSGVLPGMVEDPQANVKKNNVAIVDVPKYKFTGVIDEVIWSQNEEKVLVKVTYDNRADWVLVDLRDMAKSLNLTKAFGLGEEVRISMIDNSASHLYVLDKQKLRRVNALDGVISRVLLDNVLDYASRGVNVVYITQDVISKKRVVGTFRDDDKGGMQIAEVPEAASVKVALSRYFDEDYIIYSFDNKMTILYGRMPSYDENNVGVTDLKKLVEECELVTIPERLSVSLGGEYVVAQKGEQRMVIDLDEGDLFEYETPSSQLRWFDDGMMYANVEGEIEVWDFDGTNRRNLAKSVKEDDARVAKIFDMPVLVTTNNRWLYYLVASEDGLTLTREKIRD